MGSGKSYTARRLAQLLEMPCIDLDDYIVAAEDRSIPIIFRDSGEVRFRELERDCLRQMEQFPRAIIATGGGAPCYHGNMEWMNAHGITVFLDVSPTLLLGRLEQGRSERPLLQSTAELNRFIDDKLAERRPFYEQAQLIIQVDRPDEDPAQRIFDNFAQLLGH
jgi:shikimate kinase